MGTLGLYSVTLYDVLIYWFGVVCIDSKDMVDALLVMHHPRPVPINIDGRWWCHMVSVVVNQLTSNLYFFFFCKRSPLRTPYGVICQQAVTRPGMEPTPLSITDVHKRSVTLHSSIALTSSGHKPMQSFIIGQRFLIFGLLAGWKAFSSGGTGLPFLNAQSVFEKKILNSVLRLCFKSRI